MSWNDLKARLAEMSKQFSSWVATLASAGGMYWMQLSHDDQVQLLSSFPQIKSIPVAIFVVYVIVKAIPQNISKKDNSGS